MKISEMVARGLLGNEGVNQAKLRHKVATDPRYQVATRGGGVHFSFGDGYSIEENGKEMLSFIGAGIHGVRGIERVDEVRDGKVSETSLEKFAGVKKK